MDDTDMKAIERVVATLEHAQQNELPDEFASLFRQDAIWTTGHGKLLIGRDAISAFTHQVLPGAMQDTTVSYEIVHVLSIRPDVAAVKVRQRSVTVGAAPAEGTPLYVMAKEDGRWLLTANQNTVVVDG